MRWRRFFILAASWAAVAPAAAEQPAPVTVLYQERAPYMINSLAEPLGLLAGVIRRAFNEAEIPFKWEEQPFGRHLAAIRANESRICAAGWFKRPERETYGLFTVPIYRDRPTAVMGRIGDTRLSEAGSVSDLLEDRGLDLLISSGFSYGAVIDGLIREFRPRTGATTVDQATMAQLVSMGRYDYFFIAKEEGRHLLDANPELATRLALFTHLAGVPQGNTRHLICAFKVGHGTVEKLNAKIGEAALDLADNR